MTLTLKDLNWKNATRIIIRRGSSYRNNSKLYEIEFRWDQLKSRSGEGFFSKFLWNNMNRQLPMPQKNQVVYVDTKDVARVCNKLGLRFGEEFTIDTNPNFEFVTWHKSLKGDELEQKRLLGKLTVNDLHVDSIESHDEVDDSKVDWTKFAGAFSYDSETVIKKEETINVKIVTENVASCETIDTVVDDKDANSSETPITKVDWTKFAGSFSYK